MKRPKVLLKKIRLLKTCFQITANINLSSTGLLYLPVQKNNTLKQIAFKNM